jgi:exodeoxyribonuclease-5
VSNRRLVLNAGQAAAEADILAAVRAHTEFWLGEDKAPNDWLLLGAAGCGKTFLMGSLVRKLLAMSRTVEKNASGRVKNLRVAVCAPTHKAVQVIKAKLEAAGLAPGPPGSPLWCGTIHSLLGLKPIAGDSERQVLKRQTAGYAGLYDVVAIDESSMVGRELQRFIDADLAGRYTLYIGDAAQLPPVGEPVAPVFARMPAERTSTLTEIVRQAAGNPILRAATALRLQQERHTKGSQIDRAIDWSWCKEDIAGHQGVYLAAAGGVADTWLEDAFTSEAFRRDNDSFRYVAWTNQRVHEVNARVRRWIYGETVTPFVPGERVICRQPILAESGAPIFTTNEEAIVSSIKPDEKRFRFASLPSVGGWSITLPVWAITLEGGGKTVAYLPQDRQEIAALDRRLCAEAKVNRLRWRERFAFLEELADLRACYSLTTHSAQGATFKCGFVDVQDIAKAGKSDIMIMQQLFYVAITRFSESVVLVG